MGQSTKQFKNHRQKKLWNAIKSIYYSNAAFNQSHRNSAQKVSKSHTSVLHTLTHAHAQIALSSWRRKQPTRPISYSLSFINICCENTENFKPSAQLVNMHKQNNKPKRSCLLSTRTRCDWQRICCV